MSERSTQTFRAGRAEVTVFNVGDIYLPLAEHMNVPTGAGDRYPQLAELAEQVTLPIHSIHIQLPSLSVMVDAGDYDLVPGSEYAIEGYKPPPSLLRQMVAEGVDPESVDHVVITHRHWDHFNGTTQRVDGRLQPCFPNARHHLSSVDWQDMSEVLRDSNSVESSTVGLLYEWGLLELVEGDQEISQGLSVLAAPGETAGHQILRVRSDRETLYCLGDLYHHPIEFEHPEWMVSWADGETTQQTRAALSPTAIDEQAILVSTHIRKPGRLHQLDGRVCWAALDAP